MFVDLLGLLDDGSDRSPRVPATARRTLELPMGARATLRVKVLTVGNAPVPLDDSIVRLFIKRSFLDTASLLTLTASRPSGAARNVVDIDWNPALLKKLTPGRYTWDLWRARARDRDQLIPTGPLVMLPVGGKFPDVPAVASVQSGAVSIVHGSFVDVVGLPYESARYVVTRLDVSDDTVKGGRPLVAFGRRRRGGFRVYVSDDDYTGTVTWQTELVPQPDPTVVPTRQLGIWSFEGVESARRSFPVPFASSGYVVDSLVVSIDALESIDLTHGGIPAVVVTDQAAADVGLNFDTTLTGSVDWSAHVP